MPSLPQRSIITDMTPDVVIVGPGAMGCLLAALLDQAEYRVGLLDHDLARAAQLAESGLQCVTGDAVREAHPLVSASASAWDPPAIMIMGVKAYQSAAAIAHATPLIGPRTIVASLQNGVGNLECYAPHVPNGRLVAGTTAQGATLLETGTVQHAGFGPTALAPWGTDAMDATHDVAALLRRAMVDVSTHDDATELLWRKLLVNAAINPVAALAGVTNGEIIAREELRTASRGVVEEGVAVAATCGITLSHDAAWDMVVRVCEQTRDNTCSMRQDLGRRRRTEIDAINGAIVDAGQAAGMATPCNADLVRRIREREPPR